MSSPVNALTPIPRPDPGAVAPVAAMDLLRRAQRAAEDRPTPVRDAEDEHEGAAPGEQRMEEGPSLAATPAMPLPAHTAPWTAAAAIAMLSRRPSPATPQAGHAATQGEAMMQVATHPRAAALPVVGPGVAVAGPGTAATAHAAALTQAAPAFADPPPVATPDVRVASVPIVTTAAGAPPSLPSHDQQVTAGQALSGPASQAQPIIAAAPRHGPLHDGTDALPLPLAGQGSTQANPHTAALVQQHAGRAPGAPPMPAMVPASVAPPPVSTINVPFTSWGPGHQVSASWPSASSPTIGTTGTPILLRSSSDPTQRAVSSALASGDLSAIAALQVEALDSTDDPTSDRPSKRPLHEDDE